MNEIVFAFNKKPKNAILPYIIDNSSLPISLEFVFAGINWRNMTDHPIDPTLVDDLLKLLGREREKKVVEDAEVATETTPHLTEREKHLLSLHDLEFVIFKENGKYGFKLRSTGEIVIPLKYDAAYDFREGLAAVDLNGKWGFIDKTGKDVIPFKYDNGGYFCDGLVNVKLNGKLGYIDKTGKEVIPLKYDDASSFSGGKAKVMTKNIFGIDKEFYIDKNGNRVEE